MVKVALCVSGRWDGIDFTDRLREIVPHDEFYTATYTGSDYDADFYMDEPEVTYHPVLDTVEYGDDESRNRRKYFSLPEDVMDSMQLMFSRKSLHWNKQILIHNHMMKNIPPCDVVIRSRFDAVVSDQIDWGSHIQQSFNRTIPIGFNTLNVYPNSIRYYNQLNDMQDGAIFYINDALIIHPYEIWNCDLVDQLYKDKELKGAEEGWYQILSEPSNHYHLSYSGGVYLNEYWDRIQDVDQSLHNKSG